MPTPFLKRGIPGEEGGTAVAKTLSGKNNPAGRLPVTFYTGVDQLPNFEDYGMANRTYRYFSGKPLYPFGYGLSYTTFSTAVSFPRTLWTRDNQSNAEVTVTNTGKVAGERSFSLSQIPAGKGGACTSLFAASSASISNRVQAGRFISN